jgi:hypothetical protein
VISLRFFRELIDSHYLYSLLTSWMQQGAAETTAALMILQNLMLELATPRSVDDPLRQMKLAETA